MLYYFNLDIIEWYKNLTCVSCVTNIDFCLSGCGLLAYFCKNLKPDNDLNIDLNDNLYDYNFKMVYGYYYAFDLIGKEGGWGMWFKYIRKLSTIFIISFILVFC